MLYEVCCGCVWCVYDVKLLKLGRCELVEEGEERQRRRELYFTDISHISYHNKQLQEPPVFQTQPRFNPVFPLKFKSLTLSLSSQIQPKFNHFSFPLNLTKVPLSFLADLHF